VFPDGATLECLILADGAVSDSHGAICVGNTPASDESEQTLPAAIRVYCVSAYGAVVDNQSPVVRNTPTFTDTGRIARNVNLVFAYSAVAKR
jgi:hypothetical protein